MKKKMILQTVCACAVLLLIGTGCDRQPKAETQPSTSEAASSDASKTLDTIKAGAQQVVAQATNQVIAVEAQAQGLIDKAKGLVADQKYQEALSSLNQLVTAKLTPDQEKIVDDLKMKIQAALAKASGVDVPAAVGGALGGKQ